ncbi:hypothetical protein Vafri_3779 [Volvox africanus]|uniref:Translin family protein n=1 Tax=Volvox africanus TaxID=51714 RepID=A0A8J4AX00_9CHLO|nr:hypothetical protein Vafri_3779 [Volvox africanus]
MLSSHFFIFPRFSFCRRETQLSVRDKFQVQGGLEILTKSWQHPSTTHRVFCTSGIVSHSEPSASKAPVVGGGGSGSVLAPGGTAAASTASEAMSERAMLATSDWERLGEYLAAYDATREGVIKRCRDVQKLAKQAVYSLHRGDVQGAVKQLAKAEAVAEEISPCIAKYPALRSGSFAAAVEEYVEARAFACFLAEGRLIRSDELPLAEPEEFLGGVLDFTGELNRYAIARATVRDRAAVQLCRDLVDALMGRFLQFDLRNGSLRKKYDSLKYTLKKMEGTLYELALTEGMGLKISSEDARVEPPTAAGEGEEEDM